MAKSNKLALATVFTVVLGLILSGFAQTPVASAASKSTQSLDYCGPAFTSKSAMISWLLSHPRQRNKAEVYVRRNAAYYHIRADQSFIAWLTMPNVKFKKAPAGYTIYSNTGCDANANVVPYNGRLSVSRLPMLWWCGDAKGSGYNCTPIAKYYCRNWVMGRKVFPTPVVVKKPTPRPQRPFVWERKIALDQAGVAVVGAHFKVREYDKYSQKMLRKAPTDLASGAGWQKVFVTRIGNKRCEQVRSPWVPESAVCYRTVQGGRYTFINRLKIVQAAPIYIFKTCEDAIGRQLAGGCTPNTFFFNVTTSDGRVFNNVVFNPEPFKDFVVAGQCVVGSKVRGIERDLAGWKVAESTPKDQTVDCTPAGARLSYKNQQVSVVVTTPTPAPTPTPKTGEPGAGTPTPGVPGGPSPGTTPGTGTGLKCTDRSTELPRDAASDEYADLFGYCTKK